MLDRKFILNHQELIAESAKKRLSDCDVLGFVKAERARLALETQLQDISTKANQLARNQKSSPEEKKIIGKNLREQKQDIAQKLAQESEKARSLLLDIPNLIHPQTPIGEDETSSKTIKMSKVQKKTFPFTPKDHVELGEALGLFDFKNASQVAGAGFYYLCGDGVLLELALQNYALKILLAKGFTPIIPPEMVRETILSGVGYTPKGAESNSYHIEGSDLHLIATSEIPLCGLFAGQIIKRELPIKLSGLSHCFRSERAAGKATRGLFRVHQFNKLEMIMICAPEHSADLHDELLNIECEIFDGLEIPYRVLDVASGDLGAPAFRKYDIEAWMPARYSYGEITSASNCTDYQARRLNIRIESEGKKRHPHILNGTAMAIGRTMIALMENHQLKNGDIVIPQKLQSFFGKDKISPPKKALRKP